MRPSRAPGVRVPLFVRVFVFVFVPIVIDPHPPKSPQITQMQTDQSQQTADHADKRRFPTPLRIRWDALASAAFVRLTVRYRLPRVSHGRREWQADDSASCGRAGHDVSRPSIVGKSREALGPRNVTAGLPREARRGEGAYRLCRPPRTRGFIVPGRGLGRGRGREGDLCDLWALFFCLRSSALSAVFLPAGWGLRSSVPLWLYRVLSLIHISEPTRQYCQSRIPSSA